MPLESVLEPRLRTMTDVKEALFESSDEACSGTKRALEEIKEFAEEYRKCNWNSQEAEHNWRAPPVFVSVGSHLSIYSFIHSQLSIMGVLLCYS